MAIKSFTIKIGSDISDFKKGLKEADKAITSSKKQANALQQSLKVEFDSSKFKTAQKVAQQALDLTNQKVQALRQQLDYLESTGNVDTDSYYDLQTQLAKSQIEAEKLKKNLKELNELNPNNLTNNINKLASSLSNAGKSTLKLSVLASSALLGMYKLSSSAVETGDNIQTLADQYSLSAKQIQKWNYIALQTDVSSEKLYKGITKVRDAVGTALNGESNAATTAIENLVGDLKNLPSDSEGAFQTIVYALGKVENSTLQAYYANEIFGEELATNLIPLLQKGSGTLNELCNEFEDVGYLSNEQVKALSELDNELNTMKEKLTLAKNELGVALLPVLEVLSEFVTETLIPAIQWLAEKFESLPGGIQKGIIGFVTFLAVLSPVLTISSKLFGTIGSLIKTLPNLSKCISALNTPLGRTMTTMGVLFTTISLINEIVKAWGSMNTWQKVISILGAITVAALGAAVAFGAFHSAWSLGLAVAGIIAGIVAVTAAVNAAKNSIDSSTSDIATPSITGGSGSYNVPDYGNAGQYSNTTNNDNSQVVNNITINADSASAEDIYDIITKKLAIKVQARS
ncbi:MAG: hypothetical protein ACI4R8_01130 [Candidatus Caccovivens sp.]